MDLCTLWEHTALESCWENTRAIMLSLTWLSCPVSLKRASTGGDLVWVCSSTMLSGAAASHGKTQLHPAWWAARADLPEIAGLATFLLTSAFLLPRLPGLLWGCCDSSSWPKPRGAGTRHWPLAGSTGATGTPGAPQRAEQAMATQPALPSCMEKLCHLPTACNY